MASRDDVLADAAAVGWRQHIADKRLKPRLAVAREAAEIKDVSRLLAALGHNYGLRTLVPFDGRLIAGLARVVPDTDTEESTHAED